LAAIHPGARNPNRLSNYKPYENTLDISGFIFLLPVKDIPKFEKQNPSISVNVLCSGDMRGYVPLYISKKRDHSHHVNLFLLDGRDNTHHYVQTKNISRLVAGRTTARDATFVRNHCLHPFRTKRVHDRNATNCQRHPPQDVKYPDSKNPKKRVLEFHNKAARFRLSFHLVCDFQSFLTTLVHNEEDVDAKKQPI